MKLKTITCKNCTEQFTEDLHDKDIKSSMVRNCGLSTTRIYKVRCPYCGMVNEVKITEVIG